MVWNKLNNLKKAEHQLKIQKPEIKLDDDKLNHCFVSA